MAEETASAAWGERMGTGDRIVVGVFVGIPFVAVIASVVVLWGWGVTWHDLVIGAVMYAIAVHGITIGYHRLFTHKAFKAARPLKIALAVAGTMAVEGDAITWCADHRRHHQFADQPGDPHSPWRFGTSVRALLKGMVWAHVGWTFNNDKTNQRKYVPDLLADRDLVMVARWQPLIVLFSFGAPAVAGGLWGEGSWDSGAAWSAFFWAGLVRIGLLHHVTWSINSICHISGDRPFRVRDRSGNVWWLAPLSGGESWHNLHHADPTSARHGVLRGQLDSSARLIRLFELASWASAVRWPDERRLARLSAADVRTPPKEAQGPPRASARKP
ncbi:stearoyl-CoA 9-desaturase [Streptomyces longisporoflavus]|uniref:acyl-CoA desaturase n=1 Tax=Streptomyces longisporoflavus TaxID=28044 RepID=UPI00167EB2D0|nr:fatty acid desaturase [Streptomyces longisporoflavus]GGV42007.1 stearoyl-CoA 9-desaturase [Streptomyces longisporoflavus]